MYEESHTYSMSCYARRGCCASLTRYGDKARRQISLPYFELYCAWEKVDFISFYMFYDVATHNIIWCELTKLQLAASSCPRKVVGELSSATHPKKYKVNFHVVWFYIKKFIILMNISLVDVDCAYIYSLSIISA